MDGDRGISTYRTGEAVVRERRREEEMTSDFARRE